MMYPFFKRFMDVFLSSLFILFFLPVGAAIALILRFSGEGKIFYLQRRVGRNGSDLKLFKFATMLENSQQLGAGDITLKDDPRVLPFGSFLRKTKLNEVPQLINILLGQMSLVGPRPLTPKIFALYPLELQRKIASIKPGLTGIGSIVFRDEERLLSRSKTSSSDFYSQSIAPYKGRLELWYLEHRAFFTDALLILLTAWAVLAPRSNLTFRILKDLPTRPDFL